MTSNYKGPSFTPTAQDNLESVITTVCSLSSNWVTNTGTIISEVTSTGMFFTTTINGSAVALPIYIY